MNDNNENLKGVMETIDALVGSAFDLLNGFIGIWFLIVVPASLILFFLYVFGILQ